MGSRKNIILSKKYGLNPSVTHCVCCGDEIGVALFGDSYKDKDGKKAEAPRDVYMGLCDRCQGVVDQGGVLIIEVRDGEEGKEDPYRTGRMVGCSKNFKERFDIQCNIAYMEESLFSKLFNEYLIKEEKAEV